MTGLGAPLDLATSGALAVLAGLPGLGPVRLQRLLQHHRPLDALDVVRGHRSAHPSVRDGIPGDCWSRWSRCRLDDPAAVGARLVAAGIVVRLRGHADYPLPLLDEPLPAPVLFTCGRPPDVGCRRVGVVGTRNPTRAGRDTARELGRELAARGITVVSGLATGIDAEAHEGALEVTDGAPPVAVVGNGPDRPYPRANAALWQRVASAGFLVSEWPPGTAPDAFRFPLRNRLLASMSEVLVVVESRETGGSLLTASAALDRNVPVMAVPGSPRVRAAAGTNRLLADGATPVTDVDDVLVALSLDTRRAEGRRHDPRPAPDRQGREVLALCRRAPTTLDRVVLALGVTVAEAALTLARLERDGWISDVGGWFEVVGPWSWASPSDGSSPEPT